MMDSRLDVRLSGVPARDIVLDDMRKWIVPNIVQQSSQ
jgi:hypothetical protein